MSDPFTIRFPVRFRDVDVLGHVNNAVYFTYMETARTEFWLHTFAGEGPQDLSFIVAHAECDFKIPAHFGDEIEVSIRTTDIRNSSFDWVYEMRNAKNSELLAQGKTIQVFYNHETRTSSPVPPDVRSKLL
ncbi:MAG TPA: thioesterase family protein [Acidobacteriota bacterium]|nr:thioesterase family protein [Acidobacteriota bacterium]